MSSPISKDTVGNNSAVGSNVGAPPPIDSPPITSTDGVANNAPISLSDDEEDKDEAKIDENDGGTRALRSSVWLSFTKKKIDGVDKAICSFCANEFVGESSKGTSHLRKHLERCKKRKQQDIGDALKNQQRLVAQKKTADCSPTLGMYQFDQQHARNELSKMVIMHEFPLSVVDYVGFRSFAFALQPSFKMISRNTLKRDILKMYDLEKSKVRNMLSKAQGRVSVTTDMWTSSNKKRGFMVVTAHFIDESWKLQSRILRFIYVPSPHTASVLSEALLDCLLEWNLDRRLGCLTVDNCTTNDAMVRLLLEKLQLSSLMCRGAFLHMRCAAHILNLIVQDGLSVIAPCIEKVRDSVVYWTASPKRRQKFRETVSQCEVACEKELVLDCKTRWNSTYTMLSIALEYKDVFFRLRQREKEYTSVPSDDEWEVAKDICEKLELFYEATVTFSGTLYPTANVYFSKVCDIQVQLTEWAASSNVIIRRMAESMLSKFNDYWRDTHAIMGVASILDPRFKMTYLEFMFNKIYGEEEAEYEIKRVRDMCVDLLREYKGKKVTSSFGSSHTTTSTTTFKGKNSLEEYNAYVSSRRQKGDNSSVELEHYLDDEVLPGEEELDVLSWWKSHGVKYPTLRNIAKDVLAIPVSTVASESAFSTSGRILSAHRSRLHATTVEALMCAQNWLWSEIRGKSTTPSDNIQSIIDDVEEDETSCVTGEDESIGTGY